MVRSASNVIVTDFTPPVCNFTSLVTTITSRTGTLAATWTCADSVSGLRAPLRVWVGTSYGASDVVGPFSSAATAGTLASVLTVPPVLLVGFRYYITLEATNGAGITTWFTSAPVFVDYTEPNVGAVAIASAVPGDSVLYVDAAAPCRVSWLASDPESGLASVEVCLLDQATGVVFGACSTLRVPGTSQVALPSLAALGPIVPRRVTVRVTARNNVGLSTVATSPTTYVTVTSNPPLGSVTLVDSGAVANPTAGVTCSRLSGGFLVSWAYDSTAPGTAPLADLTASLVRSVDSVVVGAPRKLAPTLARSVYITDAAVSQGASLRLCLVATDIIGRSASACSGVAVVDTSPPTGGTAVMAKGTAPGASHVAVWSSVIPTMALQWSSVAEDVAQCPLTTVVVRFVKISDGSVVATSLALAAAGGTGGWTLDAATRASLPASATLQAVVTVSNTAGLTTTITTPSFLIDSSPPLCSGSCGVTLELGFPPGVQLQSSYPTSASNLSLTATVTGLVAGKSVLTTAAWSVVLEASGAIAGSGVSPVSVLPGGAVRFTALNLTLADATSVRLSATVTSEAQLSSPVLTSGSTRINTRVGIPGIVSNNGGAKGCMDAATRTHVSLQALTGVVSVCWTPFIDSATKLPTTSCSWGLRRASDSSLFTIVAETTIACTALAATATGLSLAPGQYIADVVASSSTGQSFAGSSPVFTVLPLPDVAPVYPAGPALVLGVPRLCGNYTVPYFDATATYTPVVGVGVCAASVDLSGLSITNTGATASPGSFTSTTLYACGTPSLATLPGTTLRMGLSMCDGVGRCVVKCAATAVAVDVQAPRVDRATVAHVPLRTGATAVQAADPFLGCTWRNMYDDDTGVASYSVCFSSTPSATSCDVLAARAISSPTASSTVVVAANNFTYTYSASSGASSFTWSPVGSGVAAAAVAALTASRTLYCSVTAVDAAGNSATLTSAGIPVLTTAVRPLNVSIATSNGTAIADPLAVLRNPRGLGVSWQVDPSQQQYLAGAGLQAHSVTSTGTILADLTSASIVPWSANQPTIFLWPALSLASATYIAVSVFTVDVSGVASSRVLSPALMVEVYSSTGTSLDLLAVPVVRVDASKPLVLPCATARGFRAPGSTLRIGATSAATGEALFEDIPCGNQTNMTTGALLGRAGPGVLALLSSVELSVTGLSVRDSGRGLLVNVDAVSCPSLAARFAADYLPLRDPQGPGLRVDFLLPTPQYALLTTATLSVGTSPGTADLFSQAGLNPVTQGFRALLNASAWTSYSNATCVPVYACVRTLSSTTSAPCDVCTPSPAWIDRAPPATTRTFVQLFSGTRAMS